MKGLIKGQYRNAGNGSSSAGLLEDAAEEGASNEVPIPTQNSPKSCLDLEQEDLGAQQVPDPSLPAVQVLLFKSLGRNFPVKSGVGSVPAQATANTSPVYDIIGDKLSAPSPRGNTSSSPRIKLHLESSHGHHALGKQH